jgi:hypothetical protein
MSPRRNRPKGSKRTHDEDDEPQLSSTVVAAPPGWQVRAIAPVNAVKRYRCPGCDQWVHEGTAHVVAWPTEDAEQRRHWHSSCWQRGR